MKICLISFDYWGYDQKIFDELVNLGFDASHIKLSNFNYKYKNYCEKILNFLMKLIFQKNIKKNKAENFIINSLKNNGVYDVIIVINPERISKNCHLKIKKYTKTYTAYLYDSLDRYNNVNLIRCNYFDKVFTFDKKDAIKYNLNFLPNYIHLKKGEIVKKPKNKIVSITSIDERYSTIINIVNFLDNNQIPHETIFFGKKKPANLNKSIVFTDVKLSQKQIQEKIENAEIVLDVLRENQNGLSFRIFDALAIDKKIITTNKSIIDYDFYNPNNIFVIDKKKPEISIDFLNSKYQNIPADTYKNYTLKSWIEKILKNE